MKKTFLLAVIVMLLGCNTGGGDGNNVLLTCVSGEYHCDGRVLYECIQNDWSEFMVCGEDEAKPVCNQLAGACVSCEVGTVLCGENNSLYRCDENGDATELIEECSNEERESCVDLESGSVCESPCEKAARTSSYAGCEFWSMTLCNLQLDREFLDDFAIVVHNPQEYDVHVDISGLGQEISEIVEAHSVREFLLPYNEIMIYCGGVGTEAGLETVLFNRLEDNSGFSITSTAPIVAYQYNPFNYQLNGVFSWSNDASLLYPTHTFGREYMVMSRSTFVYDLNSYLPGIAAIVAREDNTEVTIVASAHVGAWSNLPPQNPGETVQYNLNKGDLLQLISGRPTDCNGPGSQTEMDDYGSTICDPGYEYDLTGTLITSDKPIGVWGGIACSFVPFYSPACDHLEDMLPPLSTWGKHFYVGLTVQNQPGSSETNIIRIISGADNAGITFSPQVHDAIRLNKGEYFEFFVPPETHFEINSTGPVMVGRFLVGINYWTEETENVTGDPAMGIIPPAEQYLSSYAFVTPTSMISNYVNVTARIPESADQYIILDGMAITEEMYEPIANGWGVARIDITEMGENGQHYIDAPYEHIQFGLEVYGFGQYTSYLYPGGLQFREINVE